MCTPFGIQATPNFGFNVRSLCAGIAPYQFPTACNVYDPMSMNASLYGADLPLCGGFDSTNFGFGTMPPVGSYSADSSDYGAGMYGGMYGGMYDPEMMMKYQDKWTDYMYDRNVKYIEKGRANDARINAPIEAAQGIVGALAIKAQRNEQTHVVELFEKYKQVVKKLYPDGANLDDKRLTARALKHYQETTGRSLLDDVRNNSFSAPAQKFLNGLTFGLGWKSSAEETVEKLTGVPVGNADKAMGAVGTAAGVATGLTIACKAGYAAYKNPQALWKVAKANPILSLVALGATALGIYKYAKD